MLVKIYRSGFFDLQARDYRKPLVTDSNTTRVMVRAWQNNTILAYALSSAIANKEAPFALAETYRLLKALKPANATNYVSERLSFLISKDDNNATTGIWPFSEPDLGVLGEGLDHAENREVILEGVQAAEVQALFGDDWTRSFLVQDEVYSVSIQSLFPLEISRVTTGYGRPTYFENTPRVDLTCRLD